MSPTLMSLADAAAEMKVSRITLWRAVKSGSIPAVKVGRRFFVSLNQLERLAAQQAAKRRRSAGGEPEAAEAIALTPPEDHQAEG